MELDISVAVLSFVLSSLRFLAFIITIIIISPPFLDLHNFIFIVTFIFSYFPPWLSCTPYPILLLPDRCLAASWEFGNLSESRGYLVEGLSSFFFSPFHFFILYLKIPTLVR